MLRFAILILPVYVTLFWAVTLFADSRTKNKPRLMLAIFMLTTSFLYLGHASYFSMNYNLYQYLDSIYTLTSLSVYPLFYLYIKAIAKDGMITPKGFYVLAPALFFSITTAIALIIMSPHERHAYIHNVVFDEFLLYDFSPVAKFQIINYKLSRIVFALQLIPSIYYSIKHIKTYDKKIKDFYSCTEKRTLNWARDMMIVMVCISLIAITINTFGRAFFIGNLALVATLSLLFSTLLYIIGFLGFKQTFTISSYQSDILSDTSIETKTPPAGENTKIKLKEELVELLEQKQIYRKTDLRITDVSKMLNTNRSYISAIINTDFNCSFSDLINHYRIIYSKELLKDKRMFILDHISEESGFASVNSFLRAFRKETGTTPGQFRKQHD